MSAKLPTLLVDKNGFPIARAELTREERKKANRRMLRMYYRWVVDVESIKPVKPTPKQVKPAPRTFSFNTYSVTEHALRRFKERTGYAKDDGATAQRINDLAARSRPVQLKKKYRVTTLLNHRMCPVEYRRAAGLIFVISLDKSILTVHKGESKRWEAIK